MNENKPEPRGLLYGLVYAFGLFSGWFLSKLHGPYHDSSSTQHPQDNTHDTTQVGQNIPYPIRVVIDASPPTPTPSKEREAREERQEGRDKKRLRVEIWTFLALSLYAVVTGGMWWATKRAADAARDSARVARDSVKQQRDLFQMDQQPYIGMIKIKLSALPEIGQRPRFEISLQNLGKTAAVNVWIQKITQVIKVEPEKFHVNPPEEPDQVDSGAYFISNQPYEIISEAIQPLTEEDMKVVTGRKGYIFSYGYVSYWDIFGRYRSSVFCGFYDPRIPYDPIKKGVPLCPHINRVIEPKAERKESH
jgi:hypothetical protein